MIDSITQTGGAPADLHRAPRRKPARAELASVDRLPPHSPEAEQGVLGCVLLSPNDCMGECIEKLKGSEEAFYDLRHQTIFRTLALMYDKREAIDIITVQQRLKDDQLLEQVGGIPFLSALADAVPSAANLSYYLDIVREKYLLRKVIRVCTEAVAEAYEYQGKVEPLLDKVEGEVLRINESILQSGMLPIKELVRNAIATIEDFHQRQGMLTGIGTGFQDLDKMTTGLHGGEMIVIAARPSVGKTSLAMNIAEHVAIDQRLPVGVFSLEMSASSLVLRMLCSRSRVNLRNVREGFLAERDFPKLTG